MTPPIRHDAPYKTWRPVLRFIYSEKDERRERSEDVIKLINNIILPFIGLFALRFIPLIANVIHLFFCSIDFAPSMWATSGKTNNYVKILTCLGCNSIDVENPFLLMSFHKNYWIITKLFLFCFFLYDYCLILSTITACVMTRPFHNMEKNILHILI